MARDVVASHSISDCETAFEVDRIAIFQSTQIRFAERFRTGLERHCLTVNLYHRQAATINADAITDCRVLTANFRSNRQIRGISVGNRGFRDRDQGPFLFNKASKQWGLQRGRLRRLAGGSTCSGGQADVSEQH